MNHIEIQSRWLEENLGNGVRQCIEGVSILHEEKTNFQHLQIFDHEHLGKILILDNIVQTTQSDEFYYHEMLNLVPLLGRKEAGKETTVLIIGGGDGGSLREMLGFDWVKKVVMIEIDPRVIETTRDYLGFNGDYEDSRVELIVGDGAAYVSAENSQNNPFDVITIDSTDPVGPGEILFTPEFVKNVHRCLKPAGVMARHLGVPFVQRNLLKPGVGRMKDAFGHVQVYRASVPTYIGGDMAFIISSKNHHPCNQSFIKYCGKYYNPEIHTAAFALPSWWSNEIE